MLLRAPVEREGRVVLLRDVGCVLDPDDVDDVALDVHADDVPGVGAHLLRVRGELDAAGLAAPADLHLRLHHDGIADTVRGGDRVVDGPDRFTRGHGDAEPREQLLALVLEQIHRFSWRWVCGWEAISPTGSRASRAPFRASP
jgi:hypothetical protein